MAVAEDLDARLAFAVRVAGEAGAKGMRYFRSLASLTVEVKGHQDLVSEADREVELLVRAAIADAYPDDGIVGEEHAPKAGRSGFVWVIDPIDGTANFLAGIPSWCVSIACARDGLPVVGVVHEPSAGETFRARSGGGAFVNDTPIAASRSPTLTRGSLGVGFSNRRETAQVATLVTELLARGGVFYRNASGALMLAYVAAGRLIGYVEPHMNSWDCLAGLLLVEEAGGRIVQPDPRTVVEEGAVIITGGPDVFDEVRALAEACFTG